MKYIFPFSIFLILIWTIIYDRITYHPTDRQLIILISKLKVISDSVDNINNGGCGFFALYLSDYLDKVNIQYDIVYVRDQDNEDNQYYIPNHVIIELKNPKIFIDSRGIFNKSYVYLYGTNLSFHSKMELKELLTCKGWNNEFHRSDTTKIKSLLWVN